MSTKVFRFWDDKSLDKNSREEKSVIIKELLDPSYGCYVWPSAFVLAEYIWHERDLFKDKTILELGSGTSLPGLLCALLSDDTHVILTDRSDVPRILENMREAVKLNNLLTRNNIWIRGLMWGDFSDNERVEGGGGLFQLLNDIGQSNRKIDWILGSDTFYDPKDFEDIIVTIAFILTHFFPNAKFITSYQERSSKRSIQYLLDKWKLKCNQISLASFDFNFEKYIDMNGKYYDDDDYEDMKSTGIDVAYATSLQSVFLLEITKT